MNSVRWKQRFENFQNANKNLHETYDCIKKNGLNNVYIMALVQAYEMCFELAWKTMKDYLEYNGVAVESPRAAIKEAFVQKIISDGQLWIEMMETRNKTSHIYKEDFAHQTAENILNVYIKQFDKLQEFFKSKINE